MRYFVFLEFTDPKLREFFYSLRESLNGRPDTKPIHITVRGPYDHQPEREQLERLSDEIQGYGVVIGGAGTFSTPSGFAVYVKVQSPAFKKIWWKPDYKIEDFGINPHITVYETSSSQNARSVEKFLRSERIEIFTFATILTVNMSKQSSLFETNIDPHVQKKRSRVIERWSVKQGIMQRANILRLSLSPSGSQ